MAISTQTKDQDMRPHKAFFMDRSATFSTLEDAMDWIITQAARFGMTGPEAEAKGYAQIFND